MISSKRIGGSRSRGLDLFVVVAVVVGAVRSSIRRKAREPVPEELFAIAGDALKTERGFGDRYGVRGSTLVAAAGVVAGLTVNLGTTVLTRLPGNEAGQSGALHLGGVGEPLFAAFFVVSMLLLLVSAVLGTFALRPRDPKPVEPKDLRDFMDERTPLPDVRHRLYSADLDALTAQRHTNETKRKLLLWAGWLFASALVFLMADAGVLVVAIL